MSGLFTSLEPILKKYKIEATLIVLSVFSTLISFSIFINTLNSDQNSTITIENKPSPQPEKKIFVDLTGAVEKPDVYEMRNGARLKDILIEAGGLSAEADRLFFSRNFNLARNLTDQEKIYIPSILEVKDGLVKDTQNGNSSEPKKININSAGSAELDSLSGIGDVTAKKIIENRPYNSVDELLTKKVVNKATFEKIKSLITN